MFTIGCHLSTKDGFTRMAEEIVSINGNTFQYFTRNPRGGAVREINEKDIADYKAYAAEHGINVIMGYAPYSVEPASDRQSTHDFTMMVLSEDLQRMEQIPGQYYLVRAGSDVDGTLEEGIQNTIDALNHVLTTSMSTTVLIDTLPGEGNQVGFKFEQIKQIIDGVKISDKLGVCMDASSVWAAGYDIKNDLDGVLDEFDKVIGLDKLKAIHLNDSKEPLGSKVDRHTRIGEGQIGFDALVGMINNPRIADKAFYLEEYEPTLVVYEHDIAKLREARKD